MEDQAQTSVDAETALPVEPEAATKKSKRKKQFKPSITLHPLYRFHDLRVHFKNGKLDEVKTAAKIDAFEDRKATRWVEKHGTIGMTSRVPDHAELSRQQRRKIERDLAKQGRRVSFSGAPAP